MRHTLEYANIEYLKIKEYLEENGYIVEPTGSIRREKKDVGDIDIVVTKKDIKLSLEDLEREVLNLVSEYKEIEKRINNYEFNLKSNISIHMIPEIFQEFNYTLWHSTGPKPHVKLIKELYKLKNIKIDKEYTDEKKIYTDLEIEYLIPQDRWKLI